MEAKGSGSPEPGVLRVQLLGLILPYQDPSKGLLRGPLKPNSLPKQVSPINRMKVELPLGPHADQPSLAEPLGAQRVQVPNFQGLWSQRH